MIKKNLKMIITLILIVAMLTLSVFAYRFVQRLYPNAMLELRREFIYIGTEIKLIEYTKKTRSVSLSALLSYESTVKNNSMIIVSAEYPINDSLAFGSVTEYKDTELYLDSYIHSSFSALSTYIQDKFGEKLYITSAYRTADEQQALYDEKGSSVAQRPGESEHQTGLAADVAIKGFGGASILKTDAGKYINLHCWNYGFIIRYPDGRKDVTGINYEPWHIRYVGAPHAEYICKNDITLEEYVESLTQNMLFTYDKLPQYAVIKTDGHGDIVVPENYVSCIISPDNCGNYIITFQLY